MKFGNTSMTYEAENKTKSKMDRFDEKNNQKRKGRNYSRYQKPIMKLKKLGKHYEGKTI